MEGWFDFPKLKYLKLGKKYDIQIVKVTKLKKEFIKLIKANNLNWKFLFSMVDKSQESICLIHKAILDGKNSKFLNSKTKLYQVKKVNKLKDSETFVFMNSQIFNDLFYVSFYKFR